VNYIYISQKKYRNLVPIETTTLRQLPQSAFISLLLNIQRPLGLSNQFLFPFGFELWGMVS
jgi:hypothetical protein